MKALFGVALAAAALVGLVLASRPAHPLADVTHYKLWARLVTTEGIAASYSGTYPDTYTIYPPVTMYGYRLVGEAYRRLVDPTFAPGPAMRSQLLTVLVRGMALAVHLVLAVVLYGLLRRPAGERAAALSAGLFALSPGALWDQAVWGQPDGWYSLFVVLGLWWLGGRATLRGWAFLALAALTKPQAWLILPLAGLQTLRLAGPRGVALAAAAAATVAGFVLAPFVLAGRFGEFLSLPRQISSVMPVVTANAHNLWWIVTAASPTFALDSEPLLGGLSFRQVASLLVLAAQAFVVLVWWRLEVDRWELLGLAAFSTHAWFCLTVGAHENHPFLALPLLALVAWRGRFLAGTYLVLTLAFGLNVLVHDPWVEDRLGGLVDLRGLGLAASWLNLAVLAAWSGWLVRRARHRAARQAPEPAPPPA